MASHVVVVGAGVVGLCTALAALQRGWRVTVVERNGETRDGCSYGNTGLVVPSHFVPLAAPGVVAQGLKLMLDARSAFYIRPRPSRALLGWGLRFWRAANAAHVRRAAPLLCELSLASRAWYEELATPDNEFGLVKSGALMLCKTQHALDEEAAVADQAHALGLAAEVLDARATAERDPAVRMDVAGSVYYPQDASLSPERLMAALERRVVAAGGVFAWNTEATGWQVESETIRALTTRPAGDIAADEYVLAAGSWSADLLRPLGIRIPLQAGKGYSLTLPRPPQRPSMPALLTEARVAVSPMGEALRFGGTMEIAGLDDGVTAARVRSIVDAVPRYYPEFSPSDFEGIMPWRGLRPCSPDGLPYLGRSRRIRNLVVATGHAMLGVCLGAVSGRLAAQILCGERPDVDTAMLSPDRYH